MNQRTSQPLETVKWENNEHLTIQRPDTHSRDTGMSQGTRQRACQSPWISTSLELHPSPTTVPVPNITMFGSSATADWCRDLLV